jgi:hypothetical protein
VVGISMLSEANLTVISDAIVDRRTALSTGM